MMTTRPMGGGMSTGLEYVPELTEIQRRFFNNNIAPFVSVELYGSLLPV